MHLLHLVLRLKYCYSNIIKHLVCVEWGKNKKASKCLCETYSPLKFAVCFASEKQNFLCNSFGFAPML